MFLVTTADQRFWKKDEKILFLGEWCKIYSQKNIWSSLDYEVLPYHWDDRKRLYHDYLHLDAVYERYLKLLAEQLNELHQVDHSIRYWRIIIGPWLYYFIQILYDRYLSIRTAIESGLVTGTWIIPKTPEVWIPRDFTDFQGWYISDEYNQYLYSRIIETLGGIPFDLVNAEKVSPIDIKFNFNQSSSSKHLARRLMEIYARIRPSGWNRIVFVGSYFSNWDLILLQLSLKQLPYLLASTIVPEDVAVKSSLRKKLILKQSSDEFESILNWFLVEQIPKTYVEGYADMHQRSLNAFPKKPEVIFTANAHHSDEGFKFWAAHQVEHGAKLIGTHHGGLYGSSLWMSAESHEISIYDRYYTWGWQIDCEPKTVPMTASKLIGRILKPDSKGFILWVATSIPRYSYWMYSGSVGPQMLNYINEQYRLARSVSPEAHKILLLRLFPHPHDFGWNVADRWAEMDPMLKLYKGPKSMAQQLNESRLFIGTYNATTYLETLSANFPTILFWNPKHWELRPSAQPYFDKLRRVGILHDTPESAAAKVNEIYKDPIAWWNQIEIQEAKDEFCGQFARTSKNWLKEWKTELFNLAKNRI